MQKNTGIKRIMYAARYSWQGLCAAYRYEAAFRQECWGVAVLVPLACWLDVSVMERLAMIISLLFVLVVELLNSAVEAVVDRIGVDPHPLAGRAKDMGSAAVMVALVIAALVWGGILWGHG